MTALKNPYGFTDAILLREIRRIARKGKAGLDQKADDRLDLLLEVVYQRLWERSPTRLEILTARVETLERRRSEALKMIETIQARLDAALNRKPSRPRLTVIRGEGA